MFDRFIKLILLYTSRSHARISMTRIQARLFASRGRPSSR